MLMETSLYMIISSISFYADSNRLAILEKLQHSLKPVFTFSQRFPMIMLLQPLIKLR
jgi:hypothetical protein